MKEESRVIFRVKDVADKSSGATFADNLPRNFLMQEKTALMAQLDCALDQQNIVCILKLAGSNNAQIFSLLTTMLFSLLYSLGYKDCDNFLVWSPVAELKNSWVALTAQITANTNFTDLLLDVTKELENAGQSAHYFDLNLDDPASSNVALVFENLHGKNYLPPFPITFIFSRREDVFHGRVEYNQLIYSQETIVRIISCFNHLLQAVLKNLDVVISEVSLLSEQEQHQLIVDFNQTQTAYPREQTIVSLFYQQVAKNPQRTAVIFKEQCFSYQEINQKSNQLAHMLRQLGVTKNSIVALISRRSHYIVIGMLAILKAGGAYLPIDPAYPRKRIQNILQDSQASVIVTEEALVADINYIAHLVDYTDETIYQGDDRNLEYINFAHDLINVIYTSGSSGKPKGVMVEHGSFLNYINWCIHGLGHNEDDVSLQLISFAFDAFACNLFPSLLTGGATLILSDTELLDFPHIRRIIAQYKVSNMGVVPAMYQALLDVCVPGDLDTLRFVQLAGDKTSDALINKSQKINSCIRLINVYGPTENTVATTAYYDMTPGKNLIIGKPIYNNKLFVLGRKRTLLPIGFYGELCISGESLARGYLNDAKLSAEKFVPNPYWPGALMYCSGDLVRWLPDGNLEFMGRIDHQIKIRGLRIEAGEIENYLIGHNQVKEAIVVKRSDVQGNDNLCAYIVAQKDAADLTIQDLRDYLLQFIPDYMLPSYFVFLTAMPLNVNGKIDRRQLPDLQDVVQASASHHLKPNNETKQIIHDIWCEVLGLQAIGMQDNFFHIGGHSLKATQVASRILLKCKINVDLGEIFRNPILADLAVRIDLLIKSSAADGQGVKEYEEFIM